MFKLITIIEKSIRYLIIKNKILFWKVKYGNRLKIGKKVRFRRGFIINIRDKGSVTIGDNCFFNNYCTINSHENIKIGNNNIFGEGVKLYDHNHIFNDKKVNMRNTFKNKPITIGANNWVGSNAIILAGTILGNNNVIGAGSTINQTIGSDNIVRPGMSIKTEKIQYK